jgi:hypothetical protein
MSDLVIVFSDANRFEMNSVDFSKLSVEGFDAILAGTCHSISSEDDLLERMLSLSEAYRPLLR